MILFNLVDLHSCDSEFLSSPNLGVIEGELQRNMDKSHPNNYHFLIVILLSDNSSIDYEIDIENYGRGMNLHQFILDDLQSQFNDCIPQWIEIFPFILNPELLLTQGEELLRNFPEPSNDDLIDFLEAKGLANLYMLLLKGI